MVRAKFLGYATCAQPAEMVGLGGASRQLACWVALDSLPSRQVAFRERRPNDEEINSLFYHS